MNTLRSSYIRNRLDLKVHTFVKRSMVTTMTLTTSAPLLAYELTSTSLGLVSKPL